MLSRVLTFRHESSSRVAPNGPSARAIARLDSRALRSWKSQSQRGGAPSQADLDERATMEQEMRAAPLRALKTQGRVYTKFLITEAYFTVIMFAIFAFLGYAVRNLFCKKSANQLGVRDGARRGEGRGGPDVARLKAPRVQAGNVRLREHERSD